MPAIILNTPVFTPFSFEQYIAPLNAYKLEYDAVEKQYNEVEAATSVLEALAADAPNSQAYRTYRNYADRLRGEADALAYNGLTPGSRLRLRNIRTDYTSNIVPIVRGMEKWEKDKERYYNLKDHEIMSIDPFEHNAIDKYIGNNPSSRILNLETVRKNALLTGQAWSDRVFGDLSPLVLQGVLDGGYTLLSQLQGFVSGGPNGLNSLTELLNTEQALKSTNPTYSEGIRLLRNQLESLGFEQFDVQGQKQILNSVLLGYGLGLQGKYEYRNSPYTTLPSGRSGSPIVTGLPSVHTRTLPLLGNSQETIKKLKILGAKKDNATNTWTFRPDDLKANFEGIGLPGSTHQRLHNYTVNDLLLHYQSAMNGTININGKEVNVIESHQQELQNLVNTIKIYDPSLAQTIENGTFTQNINDILPNIIDNIQTNTKDYGVKIFDVTYADKQDTKVLTEAIARYLESNKGEYEILDLSADGKVFNDTDTEKIDDLEEYTLEVLGVSFLPTDKEHIIVNASIDGQQKLMKIPVTAINDLAMQALDIVNQHALAFNTFEAEHGTFHQPQAGGTPSDMENIWMEIRKVDEQYKTKAISRENKLAYQKAVTEALEELATTNGKEKDYYTNLFQQYQQLEYATSMMYPQFVQNFGYALGTVDHQDYKQKTYHEVATDRK